MKLRLVVIDGPEAGRSFTFDEADSFLVGRSPKAHLVLDPRADRYISRTHCLIDIRPPRCIVNDLGSTNGTFVNGERVARGEVKDGDEIRVGHTRIRVVMDQPGPPPVYDTQAVMVEPAELEAAWRPPRPDAGEEWRPPAFDFPGQDEQPLVIPDAPPPPAPPSAPLELACWLCATDLSEQGSSDGRAHEVPHSIYLCRECEGSLNLPAERPAGIEGYSVLGEIGRGGMGIVYKAVHEATRRVVAIKRILPEVLHDERTFRQFEREIAIQSRVAHPNLARLLDHCCDHGSCYFVVEFLAGGDARQLVTATFKGPVDTALAVRLIVEVLGGLEALHCNGFVHRDLKPGNILLSRPAKEGFGVAKITDYGLAKSFEEAGNSLFDLTREGEAAGSLMFMPPEQILNYRYVRPPADVYAAGVTLYYLLTGHYTVDSPVFPVTGARTALAAGPRNPIEVIIEDRPVPLRTRRPEISERLAQVVDTAVQKELSSRYASARQFADELTAAARSEGLM